MKAKKYIFFLVIVAAILTGCLTDEAKDPNVNCQVLLTQSDWAQISLDTITPPANPLTPPTENTICVEGELIWSFYYKIVCLCTTHTFYQLGRDGKEIRFDDPMLQDYYIGDTLRVLGDVSKVYSPSLDLQWYFIAMREVELVGAFKYREEE